MSSLVIVRHGQASFGGQRYDVLSETGRSQASATGRWFHQQGVEFDRVVSGPRERQIKTAEVMLSSIRARVDRVDTLSALDEFGEGQEILRVAEQMSGVPLVGTTEESHARVFRLYSEAYLAWFRGEVALPGRESFPAFRTRVLHWFREYTGQSEPGQRTLVVTSAGVIAVILCEAMQVAEASWPHFISVTDNASITEILYSGKRVGLRSFNSTGHLPAGLRTGM